MFTEVHCVASGTVQGVGYRDFVQKAAKEHDLVGSVRNRKDGTVEIIAQGTPDELRDFIEALHSGSVLAHVDSVGVAWRSPTKRFDDFMVIF